MPLHIIAAVAKSLQSYPTLCDPMDCSLPSSSVHGIFQARMKARCHRLFRYITRIVKIIKTDNRKYWQGSGETGLSYVAGGTVNGIVPLENSLAVSQKVEPKVTLWPRNSTPRYIPKRMENISLQKNLYVNIHSSITQIAKTQVVST